MPVLESVEYLTLRKNGLDLFGIVLTMQIWSESHTIRQIKIAVSKTNSSTPIFFSRAFLRTADLSLFYDYERSCITRLLKSMMVIEIFLVFNHDSVFVISKLLFSLNFSKYFSIF